MLLIDEIPHLGQLEEQRCWVYALVDPRNNEIRYVGCSKNVPARTLEHARGFSGSEAVGNWTRKLRKLGLKPRVFLLALVDVEQRHVGEIQWIKGCAERGARLLNTIHNQPRRPRAKGSR